MQASGTPAQRPFFPRIESLRGIGALAVAAFHYAGAAIHGVLLFPVVPWPEAGPIQAMLGRFGMALMPGHGALMLFFVVSGFVLAESLRYGPQDPGRLILTFLIARVARIYPVVAASAAAAILVHGWQTIGPPRVAIDLRLLVENLLLLDVSINGTLWALQLEILMAPLIALLFLMERRWGPAVLVVVVLVTTPLSFSPSWAGWSPLSRNLFAFVLGMLVPTLGRAAASAVPARALAACTVLAALAIVLPHTLFGTFSAWSAVFEAYGAVALLSLVAFRADLRGVRFLDGWVWRRLGLASGSYYVLHVPVMLLFIAPTAWLIPGAWSAAAPALVGWLVVPLWLAVMFPIALCSFHLVEAPGIALGRRLRRLFDRRP